MNKGDPASLLNRPQSITEAHVCNLEVTFRVDGDSLHRIDATGP